MTEADKNKFFDFKLEQVARQAQLNLAATILAVFAFLKTQNIASQEWVSFIANTFASSWEPLRGLGLEKPLAAIALDMLSLGAQTVSSTVDDTNQIAEATFEGWPNAELLKAFNLSETEGFIFMEIFAPLAAHIGLGYQAEFETSETQVESNTGALPLRRIKVKLWSNYSDGIVSLPNFKYSS